MADTQLTVPNLLITTYLEMTSIAQFNSGYSDRSDIETVQLERPDVAFYRFLYGEVGREWRWRDRLIMSLDELREAISKPEVSMHVLYLDGAPTGYVELARQGDDTEIAYFGLRPEYTGMGLGKHLLSFGIHRAWVDGAKRVWLHTCNLDGPYALDNYLKRGFSVYKTEEEPMPELYME